jgi:NSS family neurotransmitter:Na+ symporter
LMIVLIVKSISLPGAGQALRFLFYPDFSKFTWSTPIQVIGHMCFTLSIGMGAVVAYGSYLREDFHAPTVGVWVKK